MASFASSATTGGARNLFRISLPSGFVSATGVSPKWVKSRRRRRKERKKVGENNGQLRFVRHHGWRTQARLDQ